MVATLLAELITGIQNTAFRQKHEMQSEEPTSHPPTLVRPGRIWQGMRIADAWKGNKEIEGEEEDGRGRGGEEEEGVEEEEEEEEGEEAEETEEDGLRGRRG